MDSSSSFSVSTLCDLVSREKEDSRRWLRTQMNFLVDPLIEQLFDKLSCKLTIALEQKQYNNDRISGQMIGHHPNGHLDPTHNQMHQPSIVNLQPSTSAATSFSVVNPTPSHLNQQHANMHYPQQTPNGQMTFETINFNQLSTMKSYNSGLSNYESLQEIGGITNTSMQPAGQTEFSTNLTVPTNLDGGHREDDSDGDDGIEHGDSDSDGVELVDDYEDDCEESDSIVKKSRMDTTQSNQGQSQVTKKGRKRKTKRKQVAKSEPNESGNKEKQVITQALQCLQKGCTEMYPEDELGTHMWDKHTIGQYRCVVKDCGHSYNKKYSLAQHLKIHQHITEWECDHCPKHFSSYLLLCCHTKQQHYVGQFACSFPDCGFTGEYREKVYNHFKLHHKPELMCLYPGCHYHTKTASKLKAHDRTHQGIKPYRCKWSGCIFSSARRHCAVNHIKNHLARAEKSNNILVLSDDPKDYLEVALDLLVTS